MSGVVHFVVNGGATHAVVDVLNWSGTEDPILVTCPTCREHIAAQVAPSRVPGEGS